jgi:hypothetical protein
MQQWRNRKTVQIVRPVANVVRVVAIGTIAATTVANAAKVVVIRRRVKAMAPQQRQKRHQPPRPP